VRRRSRGALAALALALTLALACGAEEPEPAPVPDQATREMLQALGYADWVEGEADDRPGGVLSADPARVAPGANLYTSVPFASAHLLDADGRVLHEWVDPEPDAKGWDLVVLAEDDSLLTLNGHGVVERWERDSTRRWRAAIDAHHDLVEEPDGRLRVITRRTTTLERGELRVPIIDDCITTLSAAGERLDDLCFAPLLADRLDDERLEVIREHVAEHPDPGDWKSNTLDVFHTNSIVLLPRDVPGLGRAGQALLSVRSLDLLMVIDLEARELVWTFDGSGRIERQHHATVLDDDRILLFDNGRVRRWSRVLELDPASGEVVWEYGSAEGERFFSKKRGSAQELVNGNVLVTNSEAGSVFEVTRGGEIVWEFLNPHVYEGKRATIYRMIRLPPERVARFLAGG
jgi:hypothetical protein